MGAFESVLLGVAMLALGLFVGRALRRPHGLLAVCGVGGLVGAIALGYAVGAGTSWLTALVAFALLWFCGGAFVLQVMRLALRAGDRRTDRLGEQKAAGDDDQDE